MYVEHRRGRVAERTTQLEIEKLRPLERFFGDKPLLRIKAEDITAYQKARESKGVSGRTINMEIGLIHPPVGLNIYIVSAIAPDVPVTRVMWGTIPYVLCMILQIILLCIFPEIATWLPNHMMGGTH